MARARRVVFGIVAASLAGLHSAGAVAQLTGDFRDIFVDSSIKGCMNAAERDHIPVPTDTMKAYCTCMANKQAAMTTDDDIGHYAGYHELSKDYQLRVQALAPACKAEIGLNK